MCAAKLLKRNKNNNVAVALVTTERSINGHPCCNAGGAPRRAVRTALPGGIASFPGSRGVGSCDVAESALNRITPESLETYPKVDF